ncbi:WbqC family protein [Polaromonas sp.]|uniref:WbqC family protein n=1 Tax=Polaromonas sp. TaxID=1869339 RepID=UPI0013BCD8F3|nr:WbqC family protein [Polaromonas sp.]NDP61897.1 WbqC family protein [Polaromonas sp.]
MKLAIMQPYLFPYIGYFQLVAAVDKFVFYDDVNFIKNGWINRNRLFLAGDVRYITVPLSGASSFLKINEVGVQPGDIWRRKIIESMRQSYSKAPYFNNIKTLVSEILFLEENKIANLAKASIVAVCNYLDLDTQFVFTSTTYENKYLNSAARIIDICRQEKADSYFNLSGGKELYDESLFKSNGIDLYFMESQLKKYQQFSEEFQPGLSIIDVLMFNDINAVREMVIANNINHENT